MRWFGASLVFLAELSLLLALAWWPLARFDGPLSWALAAALPIAVAVFWGTFLSPKARRPVGRIPTLVARTLILLAALPLYWVLGAPLLFGVHAAAVVVGTVLTGGRPAPE
ncbi:DUF2568 domain-containing protein [Demequina sp. SYSU T00192]|uniref:DUF2568 domain-containing protein n=1 Tax=Demequina litoralis TaxID=3051660 RepID=A0ABT8GCT1_9MICO|nr:DUF2568 domain-containing protein [Demequina sp. SYSU T00192]MDN4476946.1 DUF2568 domain-containing protein [Demequina sp. SYSU T00192]